MSASQMSEFLQQLRRAMLLRDGAGLTDGQLLTDYIHRRDEGAFAALVRRHGPMVWGVCSRVLRNHHDAEDAFQATFLVLVRKAASISSRELVANWLYGVAHQTALKARAAAAKRKERERQEMEMPEPAAPQQDPWSDLQSLLGEELSRLPDKYRAVLVLCDLQGKTRKEAARQLGCPEGTVAGRLARARAMLAKRLTQRGIAFSDEALAAVLSQQAVSAGVPNSVVDSTIKVATLFAAGKAAVTGTISIQVAALTQGVITAMLLTKLKIASAAVFVFVLICGAGILATHAQEKKGEATPKQVKENGDKVKNPVENGAKQDAQATTYFEVWNAYRDNDATGDEKFLGKKLSVSGRVLRVERVVKGKVPQYRLRLYYIASEEDRSRGVFGGFGIPDNTALAFVFPADSRKQLAKLDGGQKVTIEGVCEGRTAEGCDAVTFSYFRFVMLK